MNEKNQKILEKITQTNSVSIHVRRGDYYNNESAFKIHGNITTKKYYENALEFIKEKVKNPVFFVFSDEFEWVKKNLYFFSNYGEVHIIDWNKGFDSYIDLQLMSNCKHNIIANSSFSWWAAWLNKNKNKIVISPKKWVNNINENKIDIIPNNWIKIPIE